VADAIHRRLLALLAAVVVAAALATPAAAAEPDPNTMGPPPTSCKAITGAEGCWADWPNSMPDTWVGGLQVLDHHMRVGDELIVNAWGYYDHVWWNWGKQDCELSAPSCKFPQTGATNGWAKFSMQFHNAFNFALEEDYYAVVGKEWFAIHGQVMRRGPAGSERLVPAEGVTVTASSPGYTPPPQETNGAGEYTIWVKKGVYDVSAAGGSTRYCEASAVPGGACVQHMSLPVDDSDWDVDWRQVPAHKVSGKVVSTDLKPVKGATIRFRPQNGAPGSTLTATTKADGTYEKLVEQGPIIVDSLDERLCVKAPAGTPATAVCERTKPLDLRSNVVVDFERRGCDQVVDFTTGPSGIPLTDPRRGRMVAMAECFKIEKPGERWTISDPFWMNGLRIEPTGEVTLDKRTASIVSPRAAIISVRLPDGSEKSILGLPALALNFSDLAKTFLPHEVKPQKIGGLPWETGLKLEWGPGTTSISVTVQPSKVGLDAQPADAPAPAGAPTPEEKPRGSLVVKTTAENEVGLRKMEVEGNAGEGFVFPPGGNRDGRTKYVKLKQLRGAYDFTHRIWRLGSKLEAGFLGPPAGDISGQVFGIDAMPPPDLDVTVDFSGDTFWPQRLAVDVGPRINKQVGYGFFLQRVNFALGADKFGAPGITNAADVGVGWSVGLGFSLGPAADKKVTKLPADELASVDAKLNVVGDIPSAEVYAGASIGGTATLKLLDRPVLDGGITFFPGQLSAIVDGKVGLTLPFSQFVKQLDGLGSIGVTGTGSAWFDGIYNDFGLTGEGAVSLPVVGSLGARFAGSKDGFAVCYTSAERANVVGQEKSTDLYGIVYDWNTGQTTGPAGCNLLPYTKVRPTGKRVFAAAAVPEAVEVPAGSRVFAVRARGRGAAPRLVVSGPSGRAAIDPERGLKRTWLHALPGQTGETTTFVFVRPKPGRYRVTAAKGSRIADLLAARQAPPAQVSGNLHGDPCRPTVSWRARAIPGQRIRLLDSGDTGTRALGTSAKSSGGVLAAPGFAGRRTILAEVLQDGTPRATIPLASYDRAASGPTGLRVTRSGRGLALRWRAACGARSYTVTLGRAKPASTRATSHRVRRVPRGAIRVSVAAVTAAGRTSRPAVATVPAR
jgi:hypothetical protein